MTNVAFDAATDAGFYNNANSKTFSHTVGTLTHGALFVGVNFYTNGTVITVTGITFNGVAMTRVVQSARSPNDDRAEIWRLLAPAAGAHNVVITFGGGATDGEAGAVSLDFVDQATPERNTGSAVSSGTSSTTATMSIANAQAGDAAFDSCTWDFAGTVATMVAHSPRTQRWNDSSLGNEGGAGSSMLGPADPQTLDWTFATGRAWALAAVIVANDGGAAADPFPAGYQPVRQALNPLVRM